MNFDLVLERFLQYVKRNGTGSIDTQNAYCRDIQRFLAYLEEHNVSSLEKVDKVLISDYILALRSGEIGGKALSNASFSRNLSALKSFYKYCNQYEGIKNNPVKQMYHRNDVCLWIACIGMCRFTSTGCRYGKLSFKSTW